jgi:hypothetical protein
MKNERTDELIDRLAAELVEAPSDPQFSTRLRTRLQPAQRRVSTRIAVAAFATAAAALAFVTMTRPSVIERPTAPGTPLPSTAVARLAPLAPVVPVAAVVIEPLAEIAPLADVVIDVPSLEVDALAIAALEEDDEKEPK